MLKSNTDRFCLALLVGLSLGSTGCFCARCECKCSTKTISTNLLFVDSACTDACSGSGYSGTFVIVDSCLTASGSAVPSTVRPLPRSVAAAARSVQNALVPVKPTPVEGCPAQKVTFKVTVHNEYRPYDSCPNQKEVRVIYEKFLAPGETETVTLTSMVMFGGSHEFTCTDALVDDEENGLASVSILAQAYGGTFPECTVIPIEEGAFQQRFNKALANGGTLVIHEHPETGGFIPTISNPRKAAKTGVAAGGVTELRPIPDPKFTTTKR